MLEEILKLIAGMAGLGALPPIWGVLTSARFTFVLRIDKLVYNEVKYGCI